MTCRELAGWHAGGLAPLTATVNISTRQLEDPDFPDTVARAIADDRIPELASRGGIARPKRARHRGDRLVTGSSPGLAIVAVLMSCAAGAIVFESVEYARDHGLHVSGVAPNLVLFVNSIFFLYVVHRLHRDSLRDWYRARLVGRAAPLGRRSPWAA